MSYKIKYKDIAWVLCFISTFLVCVYGLTNKSITITDYNQAINQWGWISIYLLIFGIVTAYIFYEDILTPYLIYYIVAYLYWFGQVLLKVLNLKNPNNVIDTFMDKNLLDTLIYSCMGYAFFHLAAITILRYNKKNTYINTRGIEHKNKRKSIAVVACIFLIISTPAYLGDLIDALIISFKYGYGYIYVVGNTKLQSASSITNILDSLRMFFVPGLFLFLTAHKDIRRIRRVCVGIVVSILIISYLTGARGSATALVVSFIWYWHVQIRPLKGIRIIKLGLMGISLIVGMSIVSEVRSIPDKNISTIVIGAQRALENNAIIDMISEMGHSIFPLEKTMELIPQIYPYQYGSSYLASVLAIVPSIIFGGYSFSSLAALPYWLMNVLNMDYGPGYSLIAETYYNFGWFGILAMGALGSAIIMIFCNKSKDSDKVILKNCFIAISLYLIIMTSRDSVSLVLRYLVYCVVVPNYIISILNNKIKF